MWGLFVAIILFFSSITATLAQSVRTPDALSLNNLNYTGSSPDTGSIEKMILTAKLIQNEHLDSSMLLNRKAFVQSLAIGYYDGAAASLLSLSAQMSAYKRDVKLNKQIRDQAYYFIQRSVYHKGKMLVVYYLDQGVFYSRTGKFDSVAHYLLTALNIYRDYKVNSPKLLASIYGNLSATYQNLNQFDKSLYYAKKSLAQINDPNDPNLIASYLNTAHAFFSLEMPDSTIIYAEKSLQLCKDNPLHHSVRAQAHCYSAIAAAKKRQKKYDEAIEYYRKAIIAEEIFPSHKGYMTIYSGMGEVYSEKGDFRQAEVYLKKSIEVAAAYEVGGKYVVDLHSRLADLYHEAFHDDKLAYQYQSRAVALRDSFETAEQKKRVNELEANYQSAEKDRALSQQQLLLTRNEIQLKQKNFWILFISVTTALAIVVIIIGYRNSKHKQKLNAIRIQSLEKEREISTLQHIIAGEEQERSRLARELHDGIMVLFSAIRMKLRQLPKSHKALTTDQEFNDLNVELEQAIKELRRTAHNLMPDMLLDGGLAEAVFYFCKSLQQNSPLHINFQLYGNLPRLKEDAELSLYRIIQELVQNIIRHAEANKALVQFNYRDEVLCITIEDNGKGFDSASVTNKGVGLRSIETRLRALNGAMDIRSTPSGTTVYLEFYLHTFIKPAPLEQIHH